MIWENLTNYTHCNVLMLTILKKENDPFFQAYSGEIDKSQYGGALPYFVGKQYGNGWLRTVARIAFPIIKNFSVSLVMQQSK